MVQVLASTSRLKAIKCRDKRLMSDVILLLNHKAEGKDFITAPICSDLTKSFSNSVTDQVVFVHGFAIVQQAEGN